MKRGIQNDAEKRYYHRTQESLKRKKNLHMRQRQKW